GWLAVQLLHALRVRPARDRHGTGRHRRGGDRWDPVVRWGRLRGRLGTGCSGAGHRADIDLVRGHPEFLVDQDRHRGPAAGVHHDATAHGASGTLNLLHRPFLRVRTAVSLTVSYPQQKGARHRVPRASLVPGEGTQTVGTRRKVTE